MNLNRRSILIGLSALGTSIGRSALAKPLSGYLEAVPITFKNATLLLPDGTTRENIGLEIDLTGLVRIIDAPINGIDLKGKWLCPGFVDAGARIGLSEVELESQTHDKSESSPIDPALNDPIDGYNALSTAIPTIRANGISHALIQPAQSGVVAGQMASIRMAGLLGSEAVVERRLALGLCLGNAGKGGDGPSSRMGLVQHLRDKLDAYSKGPEPKQRLLRKDIGRISHPEPEDQIWQDVRDAQIPVVFQASRVDDIDLAIRLITEYELHGVVQGGAEAWLLADRLAEAKIGVLLGPIDVQPNNFEHLHARYDNAALLHHAGVLFAFRSAANHDARMLPSKAAVAVAHGLPYGEAIKALTINSASILKMAPLVGEIGPFNTFFICDGDPLQVRHHIHRMWIEGREVSLRTRQVELAEQFRVLD